MKEKQMDSWEEKERKKLWQAEVNDNLKKL